MPSIVGARSTLTGISKAEPSELHVPLDVDGVEVGVHRSGFGGVSVSLVRTVVRIGAVGVLTVGLVVLVSSSGVGVVAEFRRSVGRIGSVGWRWDGWMGMLG